MNITIKYFGMLADITHCSQEVVTVEVSTVTEMLEKLLERHPMLTGKIFQVAQGDELVSGSSQPDGRDIALLPPFSGG